MSQKFGLCTCFSLTGSSGVSGSRDELDVSLHEVFSSGSLRPLSRQTVPTDCLPPTNEGAMTGVTSPQFQQLGLGDMYVI